MGNEDKKKKDVETGKPVNKKTTDSKDKENINKNNESKNDENNEDTNKDVKKSGSKINTKDEKEKTGEAPVGDKTQDPVIQLEEKEKLEEAKKLEEEKMKEINENAIKDIIGDGNETQDKEDVREAEKKHRTFSRKAMINRTTFSIGHLDEYFHYKCGNVNAFIRAIIESTVVFIIFMLFPFLAVLFISKDSFMTVLKNSLKPSQSINRVSTFFKQNLLIAIMYVAFVIISVIVDNSIYIVVYLFRTFDIAVKGYPAEFLHVLKNSRRFLRNALVSFTIFFLSHLFSEKYKFFTSKLTLMHLIMTVVFWYCLLSCMLFLEKFIINIFTSELRKSSFQSRIWDANYKTFIFKKLATVAEATPNGKSEVDAIIKTMVNEFDAGLYLRHTGLDLSSKESAKTLAESIFGYLEIDEMEYEDIKRIFPDNHPEEIMAYLLGKQKDTYENTVVSFETFSKRVVDLYKERQDIKRSLTDRENIVNKLDQILIMIVTGFGAIIFLFLLGIDYKYYLASIGPFVFGFSWVFKDTIKELYNCFVFHLINHPYDVGDRILIDNCEMTVVRIDLLSTIFENISGRLIYMANTTLFTKKIDNIRRSSKQYENITVIIGKNTTYETLEKLRGALEENYNNLGEEFTGTVYIRNYMAEGDYMKIIVSIEHNTNFQDEPLFYKRRQDCIKVLEETLANNDISFDHRFSFVNL
ncbi:Mechanosensitive ion channel [Spraguea lophii 42_110]|uniref:Mechanosensitive ion channel n=1 Tax=Spraguea lophii (strain 42_110) TaxID=1358809 RepID=S7WAQ5_SPRLO|nr:Mechanosensitive ion channel [Spraguea lophii 42_110]